MRNNEKLPSTGLKYLYMKRLRKWYKPNHLVVYNKYYQYGKSISISVFDSKSYSMNKHKRWQLTHWNDKQLAIINCTKYRAVKSRNLATNNKKISNPHTRRNIDLHDVYTYEETWYPKKEVLKRMSSMSGSHCKRYTKHIRGKNKRERCVQKQQFIDINTNDIIVN